MTAPLSGVRVVECAESVAASFCARILADLGAEVVKIEPATGDPLRLAGPFPGDQVDPERSGLFQYLNAGKAGAVLDANEPAHRERVERLLEGADVLVEGLEAPARRQWSVDPDALCARHPRLLVVSVSPYGRSGEWSDRPGTDLTASALSSLCMGVGSPGREPLRLPYDQASFQAGLHAVAATLCGLRERERSGRGQAIDVAIAQVMAYCVGGMHLFRIQRGGWSRGGETSPFPYPTGLFECKDGYLCIMSQSPAQWGTFLSLMGEPTWAQDDKARDSMYLGAHPELVDGHFREWLSGLTRSEITRMGLAEGLTLGPAMTFDEILDEEQFAQRGLWSDVPIDSTTARVPNPAFLMSVTPARVSGSAPRLDAGIEDLPVWSAGEASEGRGDERGSALDGVRVLDLTWNWAGPMATQLLADMGADVIRVETAKRQDLLRFLPWTSEFFRHNNRNKRSITVNVAQEEGVQLLYRMLPQVDVVVDNFRAGVTERLGLGYESLQTIKDDIICVSMSVAGHTGPLRQMSGFATMGTAFAGLETLVGYENEEPIGLAGFGLGDVSLAINGVIGTLAALSHRDRTGCGQFVDVSMIESSVQCLAEPILDVQLNGRLPGPQGNRHGAYFPHGAFACRGDSRWVALAIRDTAEWHALCQVIGASDWSGDVDLRTAEQRRARSTEIVAAIASWCGVRDRDDVVRELLAAGVPAAPALDIAERDACEHFGSRGLVIEHPGPDGSASYPIYATPWLFSATPPTLHRAVPALGQDNDAVFSGLLGLDAHEIEVLTARGVLA